MHSQNIKAVIFDMGGVFVQTIDKEPRTRLAKRFGLTSEELSKIVFQSETAQLATTGQIDELEHWKFIAQYFNLTETEITNFWEEFWGGDRLDQKLVEFTQSIQNNYQIGLLSNAWSGARALLTKKFNFMHLFDVSVFSAEVKMAKPAPEFYEWMINKLRINFDQSIFIDDFIENINAANALGMKTVHFNNTDQAIGDIKTILGT